MAVMEQHVGLSACIFFTILLHFSYSSVETDDSLHRIQIDVKPGGVEHTHVQSIGDFKCTFTYVCQGGTNERWDMVLTESEDKLHYSCTVERPNGRSYLFFQSFNMQVTGDNLEIAETAAFSESASPLKRSEYSIDYDKLKVSHQKGFQSSLAKLDIFATKLRHKEL